MAAEQALSRFSGSERRDRVQEELGEALDHSELTPVGGIVHAGNYFLLGAMATAVYF